MDTRASAVDFVLLALIKNNHLPMIKLAQPRRLKLANDHLTPMITHFAQVYFRQGEYYDGIWGFVTNLDKCDLILGMFQLKQHDPKLFFCKKTLTLNLEFCKSRCLPHDKSCTMDSYSLRKNRTKSNSHI